MTDADAAALIARLRAERVSLPADRAGAIVAVPVGTTGIDVGLTPDGLLAVTFPAPRADVVFPIELRAILVSVLGDALVIRAGVEAIESVVVVVCRSTDDLLMRWFARVAAGLLGDAVTSDNATSVTAAILQLAQLFERALRPGQKAIVGLWAELAVIAASTDKRSLLEAWRDRGSEPFDFAARNDYLEVKARSSAARTHYFSIEQLRPQGRNAWAIIVPVERQGAGVSIHDLAEMLRQAAIMDTALIAKIDRVVIECLGSSYASAANERFDLEAATSGLTLYECDSIPCVATPLPDGVLSARLCVDLALAPVADAAALPAGALARLPFV